MLCKEYKLDYRIKRFIPNDFRKDNYRIAEMLFNKAYEYQLQDKAWKSIYWAAHNIQNIKEPIVVIIKRNELKKIRNVNDEIALFIKENVHKYKG